MPRPTPRQPFALASKEAIDDLTAIVLCTAEEIAERGPLESDIVDFFEHAFDESEAWDSYADKLERRLGGPEAAELAAAIRSIARQQRDVAKQQKRSSRSPVRFRRRSC